jgi:hypothetical protein
MRTILTAFCGILLASCAGSASAAGLRGDYIEARTNDVYTGPCFSNAEVFITGHQAVMAWKVTEGSYQGVDLAGLGIAAAIRGTSTFSVDDASRAKAVLIVDRRATPAQRTALIAMAQELGGARLKNVVEVKETILSLTVEAHDMKDADSMARVSAEKSAHEGHGMPQAPRASFWAAGLAEIVTRPLGDTDHFCGNEVVAYEPLSKGLDVLPAYTLGHSFQGKGLGTKWNDPNARSSFVGHFAL